MNGFFQGKAQIEYLVNHALPELMRESGAGVRRSLVLWVHDCLTGEEPYSLAMALSEPARRFPGLGFEFVILATSVSEAHIETARRGVYDETEIATVPLEIRKKYLLKSKDRSLKLVRIAPEIRNLVKFRQLDPGGEAFLFREPIDVIFCRNAPDFEDEGESWASPAHLCRLLNPGGFLFTHPAGRTGPEDASLVRIMPAVYRRNS